MLSRARALVDDPRTPVVLLVVAVLLTGSSILSITTVDDAETVAATRTSAVDGGDVGAGTGDAHPGAGTAAGAEDAPAGAEREVVEPVGPSPSTTAVVAPVERFVQPDAELSVTRPGAYRERVTTTASNGDEQSDEGTLVVERIDGAGEVRLRHRRESDGRDIGLVQDLAWRPTGVYVLSTTMGGGGFEIHCEHDPPLLQSPRRLEPGATWRGEDTCEFDTAGGGTIHFRFEATVREATRITVAGVQVAAWIIDQVTDVDVTTSFGDFAQHSEGPAWADPSRGLIVRSEEDVTLTGDQPNRESAERNHVVRELLTLDPV